MAPPPQIPSFSFCFSGFSATAEPAPPREALAPFSFPAECASVSGVASFLLLVCEQLQHRTRARGHTSAGQESRKLEVARSHGLFLQRRLLRPRVVHDLPSHTSSQEQSQIPGPVVLLWCPAASLVAPTEVDRTGLMNEHVCARACT